MCCLDLRVLLPEVFGRVSALLTLHTTASSPTEPFAAFRVSCSGAASYKTALLRSARRHCARGLVAPLTRPALAVHFNCRQPRHDFSDLIPPSPSPPSHSAAYPLRVPWSLLVSPPPLRCAVCSVSCALWSSCNHALLQCALGLVPATANAGWRAITDTNFCRRAPSAERTSGTRLGLCDGTGAAKREHGESNCTHTQHCEVGANAFFRTEHASKNSLDCNMVYSYTNWEP